MDKLLSTVIGVVIAIGVSALLFIGANMLFDQAPRRWKAFNAIVGGAVGTLAYVLLAGNHLMEWYYVPIGLVVGAGVGWIFGSLEDRSHRLLLGLASGGLLGLLAGLFLNETVEVFVARNEPLAEIGTFPPLDPLGIVVWVAIGAAIGAGIWSLRGRRTSIVQPVVFFATVGWMIAVWAIPDLGEGTRVEAIIGATVVGLGFGAWVGMSPNARMSERDEMARARASTSSWPHRSPS
ncbi:hypothetical protein HQ535_15690 [bacterium]|nr:hypothetical protein [bacterium]